MYFNLVINFNLCSNKDIILSTTKNIYSFSKKLNLNYYHYKNKINQLYTDNNYFKLILKNYFFLLKLLNKYYYFFFKSYHRFKDISKHNTLNKYLKLNKFNFKSKKKLKNTIKKFRSTFLNNYFFLNFLLENKYYYYKSFLVFNSKFNNVPLISIQKNYYYLLFKAKFKFFFKNIKFNYLILHKLKSKINNLKLKLILNRKICLKKKEVTFQSLKFKILKNLYFFFKIVEFNVKLYFYTFNYLKFFFFKWLQLNYVYFFLGTVYYNNNYFIITKFKKLIKFKKYKFVNFNFYKYIFFYNFIFKNQISNFNKLYHFNIVTKYYFKFNYFSNFNNRNISFNLNSIKYYYNLKYKNNFKLNTITKKNKIKFKLTFSDYNIRYNFQNIYIYYFFNLFKHKLKAHFLSNLFNFFFKVKKERIQLKKKLSLFLNLNTIGIIYFKNTLRNIFLTLSTNKGSYLYHISSGYLKLYGLKKVYHQTVYNLTRRFIKKIEPLIIKNSIFFVKIIITGYFKNVFNFITPFFKRFYYFNKNKYFSFKYLFFIKKYFLYLKNSFLLNTKMTLINLNKYFNLIIKFFYFYYYLKQNLNNYYKYKLLYIQIKSNKFFSN
jgi:hypothetical protein